MNAVDSIVPGFTAALARAPVTWATHRKLLDALQRTPLTARGQAQIALVIAQQLRCDYCIWVQTRLAESAGLNGEDVFLARAGTALDARESAIVKMACRVVSDGLFRDRIEPDGDLGGHPAAADVTAIVTQVAFAILNCYVLQSIAPAARDAVGTGRTT